MRFLIDECLHISLVEVANILGFEAAHVIWRGLAGTKDWALMPRIRADGCIFVTNNARDFVRLYANEEIHEGLLILLPNVQPHLQRQLFVAALKDITQQPGLINQVLTADLVDGVVTISREALSRST